MMSKDCSHRRQTFLVAILKRYQGYWLDPNNLRTFALKLI